MPTGLTLKDGEELAGGERREGPVGKGTLCLARVKARSQESTRQDLKNCVSETDGGMRGGSGEVSRDRA